MAWITLAHMDFFDLLSQTQLVVLISISTAIAIIFGWLTGQKEGRFAGTMAFITSLFTALLIGFLLMSFDFSFCF